MTPQRREPIVPRPLILRLRRASSLGKRKHSQLDRGGTSMQSITRRELLIAGTGAALSPMLPVLAWAAGEPDKAAFMKGAIEDIRKTRKRTWGRSKLKKLPVVVPFADWDYYFTQGPLEWETKPSEGLKGVTVPTGFVTDLTSVPRLFWNIFPKTGRYAYAAIVHDYIYWVQDRTREEADNSLELAMKDSQVSADNVFAIVTAVRAGGQSAWDDNKKLKDGGEKRVLKKFPGDDQRLISWADWKMRPGVFAE